MVVGSHTSPGKESKVQDVLKGLAGCKMAQLRSFTTGEGHVLHPCEQRRLHAGASEWAPKTRKTFREQVAVGEGAKKEWY